MIAFLSRHFLDNIYGNLWIFQVEPVLNNKDIMINKYCYFTWSKTIEHFGQTLSVFSFFGRSFSSVGVKQLDPRFQLTGPSIQLFASGLSLPQRSSAELTDSVFKLSTSSGELLDPFWAARMSRRFFSAVARSGWRSRKKMRLACCVALAEADGP